MSVNCLTETVNCLTETVICLIKVSTESISLLHDLFENRSSSWYFWLDNTFPDVNVVGLVGHLSKSQVEVVVVGDGHHVIRVILPGDDKRVVLESEMSRNLVELNSLVDGSEDTYRL